jgi:hypothetical protein
MSSKSAVPPAGGGELQLAQKESQRYKKMLLQAKNALEAKMKLIGDKDGQIKALQNQIDGLQNKQNKMNQGDGEDEARPSRILQRLQVLACFSFRCDAIVSLNSLRACCSSGRLITA